VSLVRHRAGAGEPLVLIHGVASSWRDWWPVLRRLEEAFEVIALGLPGHLGSPPFPVGVLPAVPSLVDAVETELDALGLATAHLAGSSLGGWVALELARRGRARSVTACAPAGLATPAEARAFERSVVRAHHLARAIAPCAPLLRRSRFVARVLLARTVRDPDRVDPREAFYKLQAFAGCPSFRELVADLCSRQATGLESIACPVLVIWGDRDRRLPVRQADRFAAAMPRARVVRLTGAGHLPMWDEPEEVATLLIDFAAAGAASAVAR